MRPRDSQRLFGQIYQDSRGAVQQNLHEMKFTDIRFSSITNLLEKFIYNLELSIC